MLQQHLLKAPCVRLKPNLRPREASLSAIMSRLEGVLEQPKTMILLHISMKSQSFNYTLQQHLSKAPCVRLKPYLRRLDMSLTHHEPSRRRVGATTNIDFATYIYDKFVFQLYASTPPFEGALCAFEPVFAPS